MIDLQQVGVDFPLFFAGDRSLKRNLVGAVAGHTSAQRTTVRALHNISLSVQPSARTALLGGNAAGKTTLLRVMGGLLAPSEGRTGIKGRIVSLLGTGIGVDPAFTARQTIIGQGLLFGFTPMECRRRLTYAADFGELGDFLDMPLATLAQGLQVRVALGIAVAFEADILLIDEMLEHLTPSFIERVIAFIDTGMPPGSILVLAERSKSLLERVCTQALVLNQGRLIDQGPMATITARYDTHLNR